jgi:hypothetical protein
VRRIVSNLLSGLQHRLLRSHAQAAELPPPWPSPAERHAETALTLAELGSRYPSYAPTFRFSGTYVNKSHEQFVNCEPSGDVLLSLCMDSGPVIQGWLRRADALKLFELAYFSPGDILELGSYQGLSTSVMARACRDAGRGTRIVTVDLDGANVQKTIENLRAARLIECVDVVCGDAVKVIRQLAREGRRFSFVFVDHSHEFQPVYDAVRALLSAVAPRAFVAFHDYNDPRNRDPNDTDYGVFQAVERACSELALEFYGVYGCMALYRQAF